MGLYKVTLSPKTNLYKLHSSQQLFGYFCYQVIDDYSENTLEKVLVALLGNTKKLLVSSIMPESSVFWPSFEIKYSTTSIYDSIVAKRIKKIKFVSQSVLKEIFNLDHKGDFLVSGLTSNSLEIKKDLLMKKNEFSYDYEVGINIRYSSKEQTIYNVKSYGVLRTSKFYFYIDTDVEEIINIINGRKFISLGSSKNVSLNTYEVLTVEKTTLRSTKDSLLLSKYLPLEIEKEIDKDNSLVRIELEKSRVESRLQPDGTKKGYDFIPAIQEGSILRSRNNQIGCLKKRTQASKVTSKTIYYNGYAFLYPL